MTAVVVLENTKPETTVKATKNYIGVEESAFILEADKIYTIKELLANMLVSSDNDSARLLSSTLGEVNFIAKMNLKAQELGMTKTNFVNVTGLDPEKLSLSANISSPNDLVSLIIYIINRHSEILKKTTNITYNFCDINSYCKIVNNTDKLLGDPNLRFKITGGKTGSTDLALKNLALIMEPFSDISVISIVLGSEDNFMDTSTLINNIKIIN
jgi:D-alanyl-D-alanine carboxypeptidase